MQQQRNNNFAENLSANKVQPTATQASTRTLSLLGVAFLGAGLAMFMWWKMRMVTGTPRTAYADPNAAVMPKPIETTPDAKVVSEPSEAEKLANEPMGP
jgi:hypothetical protein